MTSSMGAAKPGFAETKIAITAAKQTESNFRLVIESSLRSAIAMISPLASNQPAPPSFISPTAGERREGGLGATGASISSYVSNLQNCSRERFHPQQFKDRIEFF